MERLEADDLKEFCSAEMRLAALKDAQDACQIFERGFISLEPDTWEVVTVNVDGTDTPLIEHPMQLEFAPNTFKVFEGFHGTADFVLKHRETELKWLFDLKCPANLAKEGFYDMQLQAPVYQYMLATLYGLELQGTAVYQVRSRVPESPKLNVSKGGMSRAKIATDWPSYRRALMQAQLNPHDYFDIESQLKPFDRADYTYRSQVHVERVWRDVLRTMIAMDAAHACAHHDDLPRTGLHQMSCGMCTHRTYCETALNGGDTRYLERTSYMRPGVEGYLPVKVLDEIDGGDAMDYYP